MLVFIRICVIEGSVSLRRVFPQHQAQIKVMGTELFLRQCPLPRCDCGVFSCDGTLIGALQGLGGSGRGLPMVFLKAVPPRTRTRICKLLSFIRS